MQDKQKRTNSVYLFHMQRYSTFWFLRSTQKRGKSHVSVFVYMLIHYCHFIRKLILEFRECINVTIWITISIRVFCLEKYPEEMSSFLNALLYDQSPLTVQLTTFTVGSIVEIGRLTY